MGPLAQPSRIVASTRVDLPSRLVAGGNRLGLELDPEQTRRLLQLIDLLERWNRAFNLTAVRDPLRMVSHHLLDSLALASFVKGNRVLDVGTGAGFPGLPLAVVQPQREFVLLDSNGKKVRFVRQAVLELGLDNVQVIQSRIESYKCGEKFATILTRAFASLSELVPLVSASLLPGGVLLAAKGPTAGNEMQELSLPDGGMRLHRLQVPFLDAERTLVELHLDQP